jgi:hypothetical protein
MSFFPGQDPAAGNAYQCDAIEHVIVPRTVDLGNFAVRRALPSVQSRTVGPFVFFDHFGPAEFRSGQGIDVRPHPHIGLATVTYLFDGEIVHRDSLGANATIRPGEINWMTAGRGIVHSERTGSELRARGGPIHGLQLWVGLPAAKEEIDPDFTHYDGNSFPVIRDHGKSVRVAVGAAYGARAPVRATSDTVLVEVTLEQGHTIPLDPDYVERAIYVIEGEIEISGDCFGAGRLLVFRPGDAIAINAVTTTRFAIAGGEPLDGPRHVWWNFVSSRKERIEQAKADWKAGHFQKVPGDEIEFIPLPDK